MVRRSLTVLAVLAVTALVTLALRPSPVEVETSLSDRGALEELVEGIGKVRVRERYEVAAPVSGELARNAVRAGDAVGAGQVVARVTAPRAPPLDPRSRAEAEAEARLSAAIGTETEARAAVARVGVASAQAERDLARAREVASGGSMAAAELEAAEAGARGRAAERRMAEAALARAMAEVAAARGARHGCSFIPARAFLNSHVDTT